MFFNRQITSENVLLDRLNDFGHMFLSTLDYTRTWLLKRTLKVPLFRKVYSLTALRLGVTFMISCLFNLTIAFIRPDFLLVFGPLVYGYFHLIASYYFVQPTNEIREHEQSSRKKFQFFCFLTIIALTIRGYISSLGSIAELPSGGWELIGASAIFIFYLLYTNLLPKKYIMITIIVNFIILKLAWNEPLHFVSATLFLHNWMAFAYWILIAKDRSNRQIAIIATLIFAIIHALVMTGQLDHLFTFQNEGSLLAANIQGTTWILSPWSNNPLIGQRALVLYTFGLSLHYFIWLKAIPENRQNKESPNSFKVGFNKLQKDIGKKTTLLLIGLTIIGLAIWLYSFFARGDNLFYFGHITYLARAYFYSPKIIYGKTIY